MSTFSRQTPPPVVISMGDINGIGPEILAKALARPELTSDRPLVVTGSAAILQEAVSRFAPIFPPVRVVTSLDAAPEPGEITVVEIPNLPPPPLTPGKTTPEAGHCAVEWFCRAIRMAMAGQVAAVVTCPISKAGIRLAGCPHTGHTEILGEETGSTDMRMSLFSDRMRIVHITAHSSMAEAIAQVTSERVASTIHIAADALDRLGLPRRRIAVAGLNPHAGEEGILGCEEYERITPAILQCKEEGIDCHGPYPPDTVFRRMLEGEFELVVAMYHDQGHTPFKLIAMDEGVSVTLGLPIIRVSVDHGTAFDIAWQGRAREHSLCAAIRLATQFAASGLVQHPSHKPELVS